MKVPAFRPYYGRSEAEDYFCELSFCVSRIRFCMDHREILQIKKESRDERLRQTIFLRVFIAIYFAAGYFFKLDIKPMDSKQ